MKLIKHLMVVPALALTASFADAGEYKVVQKQYKAPVEECVFRDFEFQIDGFVAGLATCNNQPIAPGIGGGVGANFIFWRYFGLGADAIWTGSKHRYTQQTFTGFGILRYPICSWNLAPYMLVGGGATLDTRNFGFVQVGGGLEWRPWYHLGFFADGRGCIVSNANSFALIRAGVRIVF
ncbi:MAG: hypothetical protein C5B47_06325 [Verrucomicrobia bacterium]|nr:MAG: hypothetical protein C5B47_06325 [Verrucomicrobiota bacterium]